MCFSLNRANGQSRSDELYTNDGFAEAGSPKEEEEESWGSREGENFERGTGESESCYADEETGNEEESDSEAGDIKMEGEGNGEEGPWEELGAEEEGMEVEQVQEGGGGGEERGEGEGAAYEDVGVGNGGIPSSGWQWESTSAGQVVCLQIEGQIVEGRGGGWQVQLRRDTPAPMEARVTARGEQEYRIVIQESPPRGEAGRGGAAECSPLQGRGEEARVDLSEYQARRIAAWQQSQQQPRAQAPQPRAEVPIERPVRGEEAGRVEEKDGQTDALPRYHWPAPDNDLRFGQPQESHAQLDAFALSPRMVQREQRMVPHPHPHPQPHPLPSPPRLTATCTTSVLGDRGRVTSHTTSTVSEHTTYLTHMAPPAMARAPVPAALPLAGPSAGDTPAAAAAAVMGPPIGDSIEDLERAAAQALL